MERRSFTLAAVAALLAGFPLPARAQPPARPATEPFGSMGDMLKLRPSPSGTQAPVAARYVASDIGFTFDRSTSTVKFDGRREIIALARQPGPRGGSLYINDLGEPVLAVSGLGGMTLFTAASPQGLPVSFVAIAAPLRLEPMDARVNMLAWVSPISNRLSRLMGPGRVVAIEADLESPASNAVAADAINLTLEAFIKNSARERSKARMQRILTVMVRDDGPTPTVAVKGDTLEINIVPSRGVAGRPSSEKIARALVR